MVYYWAIWHCCLLGYDIWYHKIYIWEQVLWEFSFHIFLTFLFWILVKVILVGHDFGGACISYAMEMFPLKISKAVFVAAAMLTSGQSTLDIISQQVFSLLLHLHFHLFCNLKSENLYQTSYTMEKAVHLCSHFTSILFHGLCWEVSIIHKKYIGSIPPIWKLKSHLPDLHILYGWCIIICINILLNW